MSPFAILYIWGVISHWCWIEMTVCEHWKTVSHSMVFVGALLWPLTIPFVAYLTMRRGI